MFSLHITIILCLETMIKWAVNVYNSYESMRSGFERMTNSVISGGDDLASFLYLTF